jgi:hypothetical protein
MQLVSVRKRQQAHLLFLHEIQCFSSPLPCRTQAGCVCWTGQDRDGSRVCVWELDPVQLIYLLVVVFRRGEQRWAFAGSCANNADHGVRRQLCCTLCTRCRYLYCSPMSILRHLFETEISSFVLSKSTHFFFCCRLAGTS